MAQRTASALGAATEAVADEAGRTPAARHARVAATLDDLARLAIGSVAALVVATGFVFWRTSWGAVDATEFDTALATALLLAPAPTWLAWMLAGAIEDGATPGQQRRGIGVRFVRRQWRAARLVRFVIHPLSTPGWLWLAAIAYLITAFPLAWALLGIAAIVSLAGLGSGILLALGRRALHDLIVGTEVQIAGTEVEVSA